MRHVPRKRFGQHFLTDGYVIEEIVQAIDPRPGEALVEIDLDEVAAARARIPNLRHARQLPQAEIAGTRA